MEARRLAVLFLLLVVLTSLSVLAVQPFGANVNEVATSRAIPDTAGNHSAIAGNVTELTITGTTITQAWQGYYGNVSGTIFLADSSDNVLYNWSLASPQGEVYASVNDSIAWTYIQCFNYTAAGTYASDTAQAGATSLYGTNLSALEAAYNVTWDDVDGVNETFSLTGAHESGGGLTHNLFYTNNLQFSAGECISSHLRGLNGAIADGTFQEVLLYEPTTRAVVFTSLLNEDVGGFNGVTHDFEMLVLENGHGVDVSTTTYYFYVELE